MVPAHGQTRWLVGSSRGPTVKPTQIQPFDIWKKVNTHWRKASILNSAMEAGPPYAEERKEIPIPQTRFRTVKLHHSPERLCRWRSQYKEEGARHQEANITYFLFLVDMFRDAALRHKSRMKTGEGRRGREEEAQVGISKSWSEYSWIHCVLERDCL